MSNGESKVSVDQEQDGPSSPPSPLVCKERKGAVLILKLNSPKSLNSLSLAMLTQLKSHLDDIYDDQTTRAVIIKGAGKGFCAGHDLKEIHSHNQDVDKGQAYYKTLFSTCTKMMLTIAKLPVPVIAQVHGVAAAAGCQLVATCDMAIASPETIFAVNGIDAGLFCATPQVALSRNVPRKAAMEMLVLGERISAERALSLGLLNKVVPQADLEAAVLDFGDRAAQKSRKVVALGKQAFYHQIEMSLQGAYADMERTIVDNLLLQDAQCGIEAFLNKTTPSWNRDDND